MQKPLTIFVHRASECLTDHESHGDGLICFSLLNGLAERGHKVYAYANSAPIRECSPNLHVRTERHRVPANSLAPWEYSWRAERWMRELERTTPFDLVWRMHPYGEGCPYPPQTLGKPLVIGPLFSEWPADFSQPQGTGLPRYGVSLQGLVKPVARRGWQQAMKAASLLIAATDTRASALRAEAPQARTVTTPVIVDCPFLENLSIRDVPNASRPLRLIIAAHLVPNKNVNIFCETVKRLREEGVDTEGIILGEGTGRADLEAYIAANGLGEAICLKGKLSHAQVWEHLHRADILISCSGYEAYGRTIVEAMSVGTPAVCYQGSTGPAEIIEDEENGLLVEELTGSAYTKRILTVLRTPGAWSRLSASALRKAESWRSGIVLSRLEESLYAAVADGEISRFRTGTGKIKNKV